LYSVGAHLTFTLRSETSEQLFFILGFSDYLS